MSLGWKGYSVTRFEDKVNDLIDYDFANRNYYNRLGESQLNGWQWNASESMPSISSEVSLNYLVLDAKAQTGIPLARRPDTSSSINWTYLGLNKTVLALQTQFVGTRIDSYSSTGKAGPDTGNYWLWHANASYQWNKEVRLFVKGINLTDERIGQATNSYNASAPTTYYAYSPRTFLAGVEYKF
jgi:outer membrane cobalamin receptor